MVWHMNLFGHCPDLLAWDFNLQTISRSGKLSCIRKDCFTQWLKWNFGQPCCGVHELRQGLLENSQNYNSVNSMFWKSTRTLIMSNWWSHLRIICRGMWLIYAVRLRSAPTHVRWWRRRWSGIAVRLVGLYCLVWRPICMLARYGKQTKKIKFSLFERL